MKLFAILIVTMFVWAAALPPSTARAAGSRIPATVYPPGAHISVRPVLTNAEMDCLWGFVCEGGYSPNFHLSTQEEIHRVGGWGQFAGIRHRGRTTMAFELFSSRYDPGHDATGITWSKRAFLDLRTALHTKGYRRDRRDAALLPSVRKGGTLVAMQRSGEQELVIMALCSGTSEIEGIALYDRQPATAKHVALTSLALQMHLAWHSDD